MTETLVNSLAFHYTCAFPSTLPTPWYSATPAAAAFRVACLICIQGPTLGYFFSRLNLHLSASADFPEKPFGNKDFLHDLLSYWLSLSTCWARIKSLCSSVSLIRKTKATPRLSTSRCTRINKRHHRAQAYCGLRDTVEGKGVLVIVLALGVCQSALQVPDMCTSSYCSNCSLEVRKQWDMLKGKTRIWTQAERFLSLSIRAFRKWNRLWF